MSNIKEIESKLWSMANSLRGTMDASEYKNYILPFMFYKYLSEHEEKYLIKNGLEDFFTSTKDEEMDYLEELYKGIGYAIKKEYLWKNIKNRIDNHEIKASDFQDMLDSFRDTIEYFKNKDLGENATKDIAALDDIGTIFSDVNLGDTRLGNGTNERAKALIDIVSMIDGFDYKDENGKDVLGDIYEYLIGQFAANAGKKGGEFYTPYQVSQILARLVTLNVKDLRRQFKVYDPTMGSGSLLLTVEKELPGENKVGIVDFYGQELNTTTYNLARMNLMMHDVNYKNMQLRRADTLGPDWPFEKSDGIEIPLKFDAVVANPPYSQNWETKEIDRMKDVRFKDYGVAPSSKADYAFVLHCLYHLDNTGTMAIVLPHGVLFRGAAEEKIRRKIIENNLLDAVIGLPANLFYGTSIPTCILVFKGLEARGGRNDILFIDASNDFVKDKKQNILTEGNIDKIIETYKNRKSVDKYAHLAQLDEIEANDYNLNIPRYVDTFEEKETVPVSDIIMNLEEIDKEINESNIILYQTFSNLKGSDNSASAELKQLMSYFQNIVGSN